MSPADEDDFNERVSICREAGINLERAIAIATAQMRAREVAAQPRGGALPALPAQERRDVAAGAAKVTRRRV